MSNNHITISDNRERIIQFLEEVIIEPKKIMRKWAEITRQTPAFKIGYVGQHLASLITGVQGSASGARGDDLNDGTEVKTCNKLDQVDKCKSCGARVMRIEKVCGECESDQIDRRDDSKWLFSVRNDQELEEYCQLKRLFLLLFDYPEFDRGNYDNIRITAFEIYPREAQGEVFRHLITNHYRNIYLPKIDSMKKANPMNLHPFGIQFYKCHPVLTFSCIIKNVDSAPEILIEQYIEPEQERPRPLDMPSCLLKKKEWEALVEKKHIKRSDFTGKTLSQLQKMLGFIPAEWLDDIKLRDIVSVTQKKKYERK